MPYTVYASREGLVGDETSTTHIITPEDMFVALPSVKALRQWVKVTYQTKQAVCPVLDVGPHSIHDDYWNAPNTVPQAELGKSDQSPFIAKNKAGIDLADGVYDGLLIPRALGVVQVTWDFCDPPDDLKPYIADILQS